MTRLGKNEVKREVRGRLELSSVRMPTRWLGDLLELVKSAGT